MILHNMAALVHKTGSTLDSSNTEHIFVKTEDKGLAEQEYAPYLNRDCVVCPRSHAIHIQPPQLIENIGQFLVCNRSVTQSQAGEIQKTDKHRQTQ